MAVLRSKRKIAQSEFENTFSELYQLSMMHTSKIPTRRQKWLCEDIDSATNNASFLKNISELHRYTHGKVTNARTAYDSTEESLLISLVNDAFYELILANKKIPETRIEYETRRQHISNSITYLKEMNRPMIFYFNLMQYSERIMKEWSELLVSELKMLSSLQKSDKEKFKTLK